MTLHFKQYKEGGKGQIVASGWSGGTVVAADHLCLYSSMFYIVTDIPSALNIKSSDIEGGPKVSNETWPFKTCPLTISHKLGPFKKLGYVFYHNAYALFLPGVLTSHDLCHDSDDPISEVTFVSIYRSTVVSLFMLRVIRC